MIRAYCAERLTIARMAPLVLLLTAAAQAGRASTIPTLAGDALVAFLLAAHFRVWDDLADRGHDALSNPDRVLVRASTTTPIRVLCAGLGVAGATVIAPRSASPVALVALVLLEATVGLCYAARSNRSLLSEQVLLARYAGFVFIISTSSGQASAFPLALAMAAVFLTMSVYEGLHDRTSSIAGRPLVLAGESVLLVVTLVMLGGQL
jgi:4-hydroxybenzoate polyprenyltransferase